MKPTVYIETTIVSYLTAWPSNDPVRAGHQKSTQDWWKTASDQFELLCSELVLMEASGGDSNASAARLEALKGIPVLPLTQAATELADALLAAGAIPKTAARDAAHIGICAVNGVSFLLTWNFTHLANPWMQHRIQEVCISRGYAPPVICSPEALLEDQP